MFDKLKKRRAYPVKGLEDTFVRLFTQGEKPRFEKLAGDPKGWFMFGTLLVNADGTQCCPQSEGEDDTAFSARVESAMADVDDGVLMLIRDAILTLQKGEAVPIEDIVKN